MDGTHRGFWPTDGTVKVRTDGALAMSDNSVTDGSSVLACGRI